MLVSVILPIYNGLPFLHDAIKSILAQDIGFELIVSDDGSSDGSVEAVESFSDTRVRLLRNATNAGIFGNLNRCIAASQGEFIQIFSQDDVMKPGFLASQVGALRTNPEAGLAYGTPDYIDESGAVVGNDAHDTTPEVIDRRMYLWIASHYSALPPSISSVMIRRVVFESVGLFNPEYRVAGDIEFYNRVAERYLILCNKDVLHSVRSHRRMTSALSSSGPAYLREELMLKDWYRSRWSSQDYRKIQRFRSASRGNFHLGWIRRAALRGEVRHAAVALWRLGAVYPLHWVFWWRLVAAVFPAWQPRPTVPAPPR